MTNSVHDGASGSLPPHERPSMPSWRTIALFGLTALAGLAFVVYLSSGGVQDPLPHRVGAIGRPRVPRLQWQSTRDFLPTLFANSTPVVLFGTPADIWPALNLWTPQHLSREPTGATILDVFVSSAADTSSDGAAPGRSRAFYSTYDNFELARVAGVASWRQTTRLQRMSLQHFWNRGSAPRFLKGALSNFPEDHWQHVRPRELQATAALRDADDGSGKFVEYGSAGSGPSAEANLDARAAAELSLFDVWMGSPGAVSAAHYDLQNNLYVQLNGTKQFTLAPPASFRECGVFPALHPRHRQARRHVSPLDATGECLPQGAVVATLSPGDVLFIPPLWLHTAQALTCVMPQAPLRGSVMLTPRCCIRSDAVSVSCCSGSAADLVAVALEAAPIPFESAWSTDLCAIALVVCHPAAGIATSRPASVSHRRFAGVCELTRGCGAAGRVVCHARGAFVARPLCGAR